MASRLEINLIWILSIMNEKFSMKDDRVGEKKGVQKNTQIMWAKKETKKEESKR